MTVTFLFAESKSYCPAFNSSSEMMMMMIMVESWVTSVQWSAMSCSGILRIWSRWWTLSLGGARLSRRRLAWLQRRLPSRMMRKRRSKRQIRRTACPKRTHARC